jgi:hypothetical protein
VMAMQQQVAHASVSSRVNLANSNACRRPSSLCVSSYCRRSCAHSCNLIHRVNTHANSPFSQIVHHLLSPALNNNKPCQRQTLLDSSNLEQLKDETRVTLVGLKTESMNGLTGTSLRLAVDGERYVVRLDADDKSMKIKAGNLVVTDGNKLEQLN